MSESAPGYAFFEKPDFDLGEGDILCFFSCYNEADRLPFFIKHHRAIGVDRFFAIDNASTDGTRNFLEAQPDVHYFYTDANYGASKSGLLWTSELADHYGQGRWCLTLDVDEMLVFPGWEHLSVRDLIEYMDKRKQRGLFTVLLDMYGPAALREIVYTPGQPFLDVCCYFESDTYELQAANNFPPVQIYGGPRRRFFADGTADGAATPAMRKTPLVRWGPDVRYLYSTHALYELPLSDVVGATLHFKFLADFAPRVQKEMERHSRGKDIEDYRRYAEVSTNDELCLLGDHSQQYKDTLDLMRCGVMTCSEKFISFAAARIKECRGLSESEHFERDTTQALTESMSRGVLSLRHLPRLWSILNPRYVNPLAPEGVLVETLRQRLAEMQRSFSWRITAPLRWGRNALTKRG
jgi:hypothetical protein